MTSKQTLKEWFSNLKKPTQSHFWAWLESYWHKEEKIPMSQIEGLENALQDTASSTQINNHFSDNQAHKDLFDLKVDKQEGKGLSANDYSNEEKQKVQETANKVVVGMSITGDVNKIATLTFSDGTALNASFKDLGIENTADVMLNSLNFNLQTGILTGVRSDGEQINTNLDGRYSLLGHSHSWNDLTEKPDFSSLLSSLPYREITLNITAGQPFSLPKIGSYEYPDSVQVISATPILVVSENISLEGSGEKTLIIPSWKKFDNADQGLYQHQIQLVTESPQVKVIYYIGSLESYLDRWGNQVSYFGKYSIEGKQVNGLVSSVRTNIEGFTKLVIGRIPDVYKWVSDVNGLQDKGFLSYIPEPFCQKHGYISNKVGRKAKFIYTDLSGQQFVLENIYTHLQEDAFTEQHHFINGSFNTRWKRYTPEVPQTTPILSEPKKTTYEISNNYLPELNKTNANTHFIHTLSGGSLQISFGTSLEDDLEWIVSLASLNPYNGGSYGGGYYGGYSPPPIGLNIFTHLQCYTGFPPDQLFQYDKLRIFTKNGMIYIVKD